ncbi:MAG: hypothetical protein ACRD3M_11420 [Thermoanaerobaculia bacterium]
MRTVRSLLAAAILLTSLAGEVSAQQVESGASADSSAGPRWELGATLFGYFVPEDSDFALPIVTADRGALHLEARYNYEGLHTGSLFVGWSFGAGGKLRLDATAMVGGVFGETDGIAPGYELTLTYGRFVLYSEGEYVVDVEDSSGNFFYNWSELTCIPFDWLRVGLVSQRTRVYQTGLDVQRGLLAGFSYRNVELTTYVFNLGWETPTVVCSLAVSF